MQQSPAPTHDRRDAAIVAAVTVVAALLAWPFAAMPFNDDSSYARTVQQLAQTGHLTYNGWATAASVAHAYWGLLWVRLFGSFSFNALRASTLPLAAGAVALAHGIARRAGLRPSFAALAALALGLSPLMQPLTASFMTDVPGLFWTLLSLYGLIRAIDAPARPGAVGWLALGVVAGVVGGTGRQIVWVVPLAVVPYLAWARRSDRTVAVAAAVGWAVTVAAVIATLRWFARQPYALAEPSITADLRAAAAHPKTSAGQLLAMVPTVAALVLPAAVGLARGWRPRSAVAAALVFVPLLAVLVLRREVALAPWMSNTITPRGVLGVATIAGPRPLTLAYHVRLALSAVTFAAIAAAVGRGAVHLFDLARSDTDEAPDVHPGLPWWRRVMAPLLRPVGRSAGPVLAIFAVAYVALLLPRCAQEQAYDRYVLPLIPCAAVALLSAEQARRPRPSAVAWALLAVWAAFGLATTREMWSLNRARVAAANELIAAGVPRTQITAGFDYDWWTELESSGHLNSTRIQNPLGAYRPGLGLTPSVRPVYRIELGSTPETVPTSFPPVGYGTLLPPFKRRMYVDRLRAP